MYQNCKPYPRNNNPNELAIVPLPIPLNSKPTTKINAGGRHPRQSLSHRCKIQLNGILLRYIRNKNGRGMGLHCYRVKYHNEDTVSNHSPSPSVFSLIKNQYKPS